MIDIFAMLLLAHVFGDFVLQSKGMVARKSNPAFLTLHVLIIALVSLIAIGQWAPEPIAIIVVSHFIIDWIKATYAPRSAVAFIFDQIAHITILALVTIRFDLTLANSALFAPLSTIQHQWLIAGTIFANGLILCVLAGSFLVGLVLESITHQAETPIEGTENSATQADASRDIPAGGEMIGKLEQFLIFIFVLSGNLTGVGFLIAAKSLLRFGDLADPAQRQATEYIIIGTLLNFAWAISFSLMTKIALNQWLGFDLVEKLL